MAKLSFYKESGTTTQAPTNGESNSFVYKKDGSGNVVGWLSDTAGTYHPIGIAQLDWSIVNMINQPTTLNDYGITDAYTKIEIDNITGDLVNLNTNDKSNLVSAINELEGLISDGMRPPNPIDCSTNPNYPASNAGDTWKVTVGGKIGGTNGILVEPGDLIICMTDSPGGTQATAGSDFFIVNTNIDSATESVEGTGRIATSQEVSAGTNNFAWITPLKLKNSLDSYYTKSYLQGKDFWNITNSDKANWNGKAELSDIKDATISFKINGTTVSGNFTTNQGTDETIDLGTTADTHLSDEEVQDIIGGILGTEFTYDDVTPSITINAIGASKITEDSTHRFVTDTQISNWNAAEQNVQSDWNATSGDAFINNKPTKLSDFINDIGTFYTDEEAQDAVGSILSNEFTYDDANNGISINSISASKITGIGNSFLSTDANNYSGNIDNNIISDTDNVGNVFSYINANTANSPNEVNGYYILSGNGITTRNGNPLAQLLLGSNEDAMYYRSRKPVVGASVSQWYHMASREWVNAQSFLTSYTETDPTVPNHVKGITTGDISNWNAKAELSDIKDGTLTLATGSGLTGSNTFSANQGTNTTFTVGLSAATQASLALADSALQVESDTLDSVVERNGVTDKAITINSFDIDSRFKKVIEPNVSGGYSRIAFEIKDKDIVDDSTTTSLYFGVLGSNKQSKRYTYISRGTYNEDKMALKFDVDNAKIYYESMNTGINSPVSSTEIATIGDIANSVYTDEKAQDAVGGILSNEFTYDDANNVISINSIAASRITGLPDVNNGTLTLSTGSGLTGSDTFSANQSANTTFTVGLSAATQNSLDKADSALQVVNWGDIGGTLNNQTDLKNALNNKFDADYGNVADADIPNNTQNFVNVTNTTANGFSYYGSIISSMGTSGYIQFGMARNSGLYERVQKGSWDRLATQPWVNSQNFLTSNDQLTAGTSINIDAQNKINAVWAATPEW